MKNIDDEEIKRVRELPIETIAKTLGMEITRHWTRCPFHADKHPSMHFRTSTNSFKCFVCGAGGNVIDLTMKVNNMRFVDAYTWLREREGNLPMFNTNTMNCSARKKRVYPVDTDYLTDLVRYPVLTNEARHFLFGERHLSPDIVKWLGISSISTPTPCYRNGRPFYDAPSLLFPYRDYDGKVKNVQSRYLKRSTSTDEEGKNGTPTPRFRFPPNSDIHIFNLPIINQLKPDDILYIAEGVTDCIAMLSAGLFAIAIPSATLLKPTDLELFQRLKVMGVTTVRMFPDQDEAGERLYQMVQAHCKVVGLTLERMQLPRGCKDFSEYWANQVKG